MKHILATLALVLSGLLAVALSIGYRWCPDAVAAVIILPPWIWVVPGLLLAALAWGRSRRLFVAAVVLLWLVYVGVFVEEARSLGRGWIGGRMVEQHGGGLRIVSLNCAGWKQAAAEVASCQPDIVLLQETPPRSSVEDLGRQLYGEQAAVVWSFDTALVVRGRTTPVDCRSLPAIHAVQARVRLPTGQEIMILNVRTPPGVIWFDLLSAGCWREHAADHRDRRQWWRGLAEHVASLPAGVPLIVGGDFNTPAYDAVLRALRPRLHDAFREAGVGWGATLLNDLPVQRIDQIWLSRQFRAVKVVARPTQYSDHRMVIGDVADGVAD